MKVRLLLLALVAVLFLNLNAFSQDDEEESPVGQIKQSKSFYIGPFAGVNMVTHSAEIAPFNSVVDPELMCKKFQDGDGLGFYGGLSFEVLLGEDAKNSNMSIIGRLGYSTLPGSFEQPQDTYASIVRRTDEPSEIVFSTVKHEAEVSYNIVFLQGLFKWNPIENNGLGILVGFDAGLPITKTITQEYMLVESGDLTFEALTDDQEAAGYVLSDDKKTVTVKDGIDIEDAGAFRLGLVFGVQYEINTGSSMYIVPNFLYNYGVTGVSSAYTWNINAIQAGIDIRWAVSWF
jgi:hypothetical protein